MRPIDFPETNTIIAENQPPYIPLPALYIPDNMGTVLTCFELAPDELEEVLRTKKIWVTMLTFRQPFQPFMMSTEKPVLDGVVPEDLQAAFQFDDTKVSDAAKPPIESGFDDPSLKDLYKVVRVDNFDSESQIGRAHV